MYMSHFIKDIEIFSYLFGSIYLCSKSLELINLALINKQLQYKLILMNGLIFIVSGSTFLYIVLTC
jgi:hypothetical protein